MQRPCRLLACSGSLDGGGSERQLWQLVSRLPRPDFAPELYLLAKRGPYLAELPADTPVHAFDCDHPQPARIFPGRIAWMQAAHLRRIVRERQIDVVYDRTFHMTLLTGTALPRSVPRVSVIVSPPSRDFVSTEKKFAAIKRWLLRRAYRRASVTLCVSQEVADDAAAFYRLPTESFVVMPNPVDSDLIAGRAAEALPATAKMLEPESPDRSTILHVALVGRMTAEKNHLFALQVAKRLAEDVHLHFIGDGPLRPTIVDKIRELGLEDRVHLHGYLSNPYPIVSRADLVLIPSRYEGYPNVALEASALGVPIVMSDYGPTATEIIGPNSTRGQLFPTDCADAAVAAVIDRMLHPDEWQRRASDGREWVLRTHSMQPWLEAMTQLLHVAAKENSRES